MMVRSIFAELQMLWKRPGTWVLLGIWLLMAMMFGYVIPYINRDDAFTGGNLQDLLPANVGSNTLAGYPFFGGVMVLILAVMTFGSDYGWNVNKTLLTQRAGRLQVFGSKIGALAVSLIPFVVVVFAASIGASEIVALLESESAALDDAGSMIKGMLAAWMILGVWASLGVLLATLTRGTSLAIGIGILYGLVFEGLLDALLGGVDALEPILNGFLRTNGYSLVRPLGVFSDATDDRGPGSFTGPYVSGTQALIVLTVYLVGFAAIAAGIFKRRDVA
jgi:ABC-type transport system involved in multi-copper enzyme maturation permease subunit